jgi:hypothetical protein
MGVANAGTWQITNAALTMLKFKSTANDPHRSLQVAFCCNAISPERETFTFPPEVHGNEVGEMSRMDEVVSEA